MDYKHSALKEPIEDYRYRSFTFRIRHEWVPNRRIRDSLIEAPVASHTLSGRPHRDGDRASDDLSRQCFGSRFPTTRRVLDRSRRTMARRNYFSALGGRREHRLWRASLHFLSARVLDTWRGARKRPALENGAGRVHLDFDLHSGYVDVEAGARVAARVPGDRGRVIFCRESLSPRARLLPQRLCRTSRQLIVPIDALRR